MNREPVRPSIVSESARAANFGDAFPIDHGERQTELGLQVRPSIGSHRGRGGRRPEVNATAQEQLPDDQRRLDSFPKANIVGDQQVHPREPESLAKRQKLIGFDPDASAERRLEKIAFGGGRGIPAHGPKMRREHLGPSGAPWPIRAQPLSSSTSGSISASQRTSKGSPCASSEMQVRLMASRSVSRRSAASTSQRLPRSSTKSPTFGMDHL